MSQLGFFCFLPCVADFRLCPPDDFAMQHECDLVVLNERADGSPLRCRAPALRKTLSRWPDRFIARPVFGFVIAVLVVSSAGCESKTEQSATTPAVETAEPPSVPSTRPTIVGDASDKVAGSRSQDLTLTPAFSNVARSAGVDFTFFPDIVDGRFFLPEVMGGGAGWLDFDHDNQLDLYLVNGAVLQPSAAFAETHRNAVFRGQRGAAFRNVSGESGGDDSGYGQGCVVGDFNADGFTDVYVTNYGPNVLLLNNGDGSFSDVTKEAGVGDSRWGSSGVWLDVNADRLPDLIVVNYLNVDFQNHNVCLYNDKPGYCGPGRYEGLPDLIYLSRGDGTFREAAAELGFNPFPGKGLAIAVTDFNEDFLPDIYVANDMTANFLYTRSRVSTAGEITTAETYQDLAQESGCAVSGDGMNEASMGISCADFNGDGRIDIYLTHYYQMKNTLYRNLGGLLFEDDSLRTGVAAQSFGYLGFGTTPLDYNGDGAPDLFVANGHVLGAGNSPNAMTPQLLQNDGQGNFRDVSADAGEYFLSPWLGRGVAAADYDDDGDTDLVVTHLDHPVALLRNDTLTAPRFLGVSLGQIDRHAAVCARVTVTCGEKRFTQIAGAGGSYLSTHESRMLFALENTSDSAPIAVEVQWPSGRVDHFPDLGSGIYWQLVEGRQPKELPR